jgi:aryl-alcohol dehydrogenase-like predicted oxidoreductase
MAGNRDRVLGRTGVKVCRLGVASSYGAPAEAFEEAFDRGCNYFYWGWKRNAGMRQAIANLCGQGKRDDLLIVYHSYDRFGFFLKSFYQNALKTLGLDRVDLLLLGWHNRAPSQRLIDQALNLKEKGLVRFVGMSGHNRPLFPRMADTKAFDIFHIRYNAAHRGAETEVFPHLTEPDRPGIVTYTATRWGHLLNPKKMPPGEQPPPARDCYRFVMSNPHVDVCLCGPSDREQMREALAGLDAGELDPGEMERMRRIGDYVHQHSRSFF